MNKQELLRTVQESLEQGTITREDLLEITKGTDSKKKFSLSHILYYIGGAIIFIGIAVLIGQNWDSLNTFARVLSTLGGSIAAYVIAVLFTDKKKMYQLGTVFYLLSALLLPLGLSVCFYEAKYDLSSLGLQSFMALISFAVFFGSYWLKKTNTLLAISIVFGTWLFFAFTSYLLGGRPQAQTWHLTEYRVLLTGLAYVLLGYSFIKTPHKQLTGLLYTFGLIGLLSAAMSLGGWTPTQNVLWETLFPGLVFVVILLSIQLRSKAFLALGSIYLMAYILKITAEYFTDSLGWPLALVIAGLVLMGIGYMSVSLNKKYLSKKALA